MAAAQKQSATALVTSLCLSRPSSRNTSLDVPIAEATRFSQVQSWHELMVKQVGRVDSQKGDSWVSPSHPDHWEEQQGGGTVAGISPVSHSLLWRFPWDPLIWKLSQLVESLTEAIIMSFLSANPTPVTQACSAMWINHTFYFLYFRILWHLGPYWPWRDCLSHGWLIPSDSRWLPWQHAFHVQTNQSRASILQGTPLWRFNRWHHPPCGPNTT